MLAAGSDTNNVAVRADTRKRFTSLTLMSEMFSQLNNGEGLPSIILTDLEK